MLSRCREPPAAPLALLDYSLAHSKAASLSPNRRGGGTGLAQALLSRLEPLLRAAQACLASCKCNTGCPSCILMSGCGEYNEGLDKRAAALILEHLLGGG